ncbi:cysteine dioxygenase [Jatrophihabitans sp. YIM 134969]
MTTSVTTPGLRALVDRLESAVARTTSPGDTIREVGEALRPSLGAADLLPPEHVTPDTEAYRQHVLHVAPGGAFSLVALVWLPGQETPVHDHLTWCVVGVHRGAESETRYRFTPDGDGLEESERVHADIGDVACLLPPGDIHKVRNDTDGVAVSLHVYGTDVTRTGSSVRRIYAVPSVA